MLRLKLTEKEGSIAVARDSTVSTSMTLLQSVAPIVDE